MKVVILAGGLGTRISEESMYKPKPMIEIGGMPILWHIMKVYSHYGFHEFIICAGYKQHIIKQWFSDYFLHTSDVTFDFTKGNEVIIHNKHAEPWKVTIVDTGLNTQTGGRVKRIRDYIGDETFLLTYGDGVGDIDIPAIVDYHKKHGKLCTVSAYNYGQHKGVLDITETGSVSSFREKSDLDGDLVNIGFMVFEPDIFQYIDGDETLLEETPMHALLEQNQLMAYVHKGYWQCMDTLRERQRLEYLWETNQAPWKLW